MPAIRADWPDIVHACLQNVYPKKDGELKVIQTQRVFYHVDIICHPDSSYTRCKLHGMSACGATINWSGRNNYTFTFPSTDVCPAH